MKRDRDCDGERIFEHDGGRIMERDRDYDGKWIFLKK